MSEQEVTVDILKRIFAGSGSPVACKVCGQALVVWIGYAFFPSRIAAAITIGEAFSFLQNALIVFISCIVLVFISGDHRGHRRSSGLSLA